MPHVSGTAGASIDVPVQVDADVTGQGIISLDAVIGFNTPDVVVTSVSASNNGLMSSCLFTTNPGASSINVSIACTQPISGGPGTLFTLTFDLVSDTDVLFSWLNFTSFKFNEGSPAASTSNGSITLNDAPLPVELTRLEARVDAGTVVLTWATASEVNNAGFEVQQAGPDGFVTLGFVEGRGTPQHYVYRVDGLAPGSYRFRLKQIDFDGTFTYSPEVEVSVETTGTYELSPPHPNPFDTATALTLTVARTQPVRALVFDMTGRRVAVLYEGILEQNRPHQLHVEGRGLPSGTYLLQVQGAAFHTTRLLTLIR
ncbi:MAG: hypothetical protein KatS3mg043_1879 [Rhodothermaceae bacterium]|nr:MAG: hypothetical protein KatS3mg043_1879 [Rhodothermaceae bacterium]